MKKRGVRTAVRRNKKRIPAGDRPKIRDAVRTRARILAVAHERFSKNGYAGTSVDDIVTASGVTKRMLYHYFGDKEGIYREVFLAGWKDLETSIQGRLQQSFSGKLDLLQMSTSVLETLHDYIAEHQSFMRLMMWEGLEGGIISKEIWKDVRGPLYTQARQLLSIAIGQGIIPKQLDPTHLIISFVGAVTYYFGYPSSLDAMIGQPTLSPEAIQRRKEQVIALFGLIFRLASSDADSAAVA